MSQVIKQGQLSLQELNKLKWLLGQMLALIGLLSLLDLSFVSPVLVLAGCGVIAVTLLFPVLVAEVSNRFWRVLVLALIIVVALDFISSKEQLLPPLVKMVAGLTCIRCLQYRQRREDLQLILLSLFVSVVSGVLTLSVTFALQLLLFTPVAMALLFVVNLLESADVPKLGKNDWRSFSWFHFIQRLYHGFDFRLVGFAILLFGAAVAISALVFISLPRFNIDQRLPFLQSQGVGRMGFSESVSFGDIKSILSGPNNDKVAFRVEYPQGATVPVYPYWRMLVLDSYLSNSFRLSPGARELAGRLRTESVLEMGVGMTDPSEASWQFFLEGDVSRFLPIVGAFERMRMERRTRLYVNEELSLFQLDQTPGSVFAYQIEGMVPDDRFAASVDEQWELELAKTGYQSETGTGTGYPQTTLMIPANARDVEILENIVSEILLTRLSGEALEWALLVKDEALLNRPTELFSNLGIAEAVMAWLQDHYGYSLSEDGVRRYSHHRDSLCVWLETGSKGWCEHFAGAMVLILRTAGVPARMVAGFHGMSVNDYQDYIVVRNRNAHAWVEVYDGEGWWVRFDPTPEREERLDDEDAMEGSTYFREIGMGAWLDSLRMLWYRRVIHFSQEDQEDIAGNIRSVLFELYQQLGQQVEKYWEQLLGWLYTPWSLLRVLRIAAILGGVLLLFIVLRSGRLWLSGLYDALVGKLAFSGQVDPARRRAGKLLIRILKAEPLVPAMHRAEYLQVKQQLELIRYGRYQDRPQPIAVFRRARRLLRLISER